MLISSSPWRLPVAKSLKSWPGVTFTAPVPNAMSTSTASRDDRDLAVDERVLELLAVEVLVARVVGVHRDGGVAEHGLGARRRDHELGRAGGGVGVHDRVRELVELAVVRLALDLEVAERGAALRVTS